MSRLQSSRNPSSSSSASNTSSLIAASNRPQRSSPVPSMRGSESGYFSPVTYSSGSSISSEGVREILEDTRANASRRRRSRMQPPTPPPMPPMPYVSEQGKILGIMATLKTVPTEALQARVYAAQLLQKLRRQRLQHHLSNLDNRCFWYIISGQDGASSSRQFRMALFSARFIGLLRAHLLLRFNPRSDNPWLTFTQPPPNNTLPVYPITNPENYLHRTNVFALKWKDEKRRCLALGLLEPTENELYTKLMQAVDEYIVAFNANTNPWPLTTDGLSMKRTALLEQAVETGNSYQL